MGNNKLDIINFSKIFDMFGEEAAKDTLKDVNDGKISEKTLEKYLYDDESKEEYAERLKKEYEEKLKAADKEAESILSEARKVAMHNEQKIVDEAKQEAARIIERANAEAELEKQRVADEVKQQIISVAAVNGVKVCCKSNG